MYSNPKPKKTTKYKWYNGILYRTECPFCGARVRWGGVCIGMKLKSHGSRLEGRTNVRRDGDIEVVEVLDTVRNRRKWHASAKFGLGGTAAILNNEPGLWAIRIQTRVIIIIIMMVCLDRCNNSIIDNNIITPTAHKIVLRYYNTYKAICLTHISL